MTHFHGRADAKEVDKAYILIPHNFDLIDRAVPGQFVPQILFICVLVEIAQEHIARRIVLRYRSYNMDRDS